MKVLAIKGVEPYSNLWVVRYTRQHGRHVQDAQFLCDTPEEAKAKYQELLDIVKHHEGVYLSKKAKRKLKSSRRKPEEPSTYHFEPSRKNSNGDSSSEHHKEYMKQYYIRKQLEEI